MIANIIDEQIDIILRKAYETASRLLSENKAKLEALAQKLIAEETLEGDELEKTFSEANLSPSPASA